MDEIYVIKYGIIRYVSRKSRPKIIQSTFLARRSRTRCRLSGLDLLTSSNGQQPVFSGPPRFCARCLDVGLRAWIIMLSTCK